MDSPRFTGTVVFWDDERKFGLICITRKQKYFLHISKFDAEREPVEGEQVDFAIARASHGGKYQQAVDVRPVVQTGAGQINA